MRRVLEGLIVLAALLLCYDCAVLNYANRQEPAEQGPSRGVSSDAGFDSRRRLRTSPTPTPAAGRGGGASSPSGARPSSR